MRILSAGTDDVAHFHPLKWRISLPHDDRKDLETNPVAQSRFVHEYVHYVQTITGTIGRHIILETARITIYAALYKRFGAAIPTPFPQVDVRATLSGAKREDFFGTPPALQYQEFTRELRFALAPCRLPVDRRPQGADPFFHEAVDINGLEVEDFPFVVAAVHGQHFVIPVTDAIIFENMARQVQRNFLFFNHPKMDREHVDGERRKGHGDLTYVCLHDQVAGILKAGEDPSKWTIGLSQLSLGCRNPGTAFERLFNTLAAGKFDDFGEFLKVVGRDAWFAGEFNVPPIQETLNDLVGKWGTAMRPVENMELGELTKCLARAANVIGANRLYFANPLIKWSDLAAWFNDFGCPPVECKDGPLSVVHGIPTTTPFHDYFRLADELLAEETE